jgi:hypothetical protein
MLALRRLKTGPFGFQPILCVLEVILDRGDILNGKKQKPQSQISWNSGNVSGSQIVVGNGNVVIHNEAPAVSPAELKKLRAEFSKLKQQIEATVPDDKKEEALKKADELQASVLDRKPNPSKMASIRNWFVKNAPGLAGTVTSVIVNPIVGKLVEAAGDAVAGEFKNQFGQTS